MRLQAPPAATRAAEPFFIRKRARELAKVSIGEFVRQVKLEGITKVVWPSRQQTFRTTIMVLIMTGALGFFFLATDSMFSAIVQFLLKQLGG
jgi:preprotein translocase subunit SecE